MSTTAPAEVLHYPTLKTVLMIEDVIREADLAVSRNQILAKMPTKVMRSTLNVALDYLERRGLVLETRKGYIWTYNPSPKLKEAEAKGLCIDDDWLDKAKARWRRK